MYAFVSFFFNSKEVSKTTLKAILLNIGVTVIFGFLGFIYGALFLRKENLNWYIPNETIDIQNFINVGSIHNFGYLGALLGLFFGVYFQIRKLKNRKVVAD